MTPSPYVLIFFGWLLGLLSTIIVDWLRDQVGKHRLKKAIQSELSELRYRMAALAFALEMKHGQFDRAFLNWFHKTTKGYPGVHYESSKKIHEAVATLLSGSDKQIAEFAERNRTPQWWIASTLRHHTMPVLDSSIQQLSLFSARTQSQLFEIKTEFSYLNQRVDDYRFFYEKTFDPSLSQDNEALIKANLVSNYKLVAENARSITDRIGDLKLS